MRFEVKRESPLDLSVKTVCRSADSTDDRLHPFGHDIPKVNFKPDFNACRNGQPMALPGSTASLHHNNAAYHQASAQLTLPPPPSPLPPAAAATASLQHHPLPVTLPPAQHHPQIPASSAAADDAWRAAIDRQIEQKFNSYTSSKKHHRVPQPQPSSPTHPPPPLPLPPQQQQQQCPAQADKRVLEILKQNIEARDQGGRPQPPPPPQHVEVVPSAPPLPVRNESSTTPLKKTDYYYNMTAERTAVTPFPKKIDYYMDRAHGNASRIRTKAERKQVCIFVDFLKPLLCISS